jgi:hypothetical protein
MFYNEDGRWLIPEQVVLSRWRKKIGQAGETFHGFRLPPGTWRALIELDEVDWYHGSAATLARDLLRLKRRCPTLGVPRPAMLFLLGSYLERLGVLAMILGHAEEKRLCDPGHPGIPDLFLYRRDAKGWVEGEKFVEVKRPGERLGDQQAEELEFLRRLGLGAGLVRLIERAGQAADLEPGFEGHAP